MKKNAKEFEELFKNEQSARQMGEVEKDMMKTKLTEAEAGVFFSSCSLSPELIVKSRNSSISSSSIAF